MSLIQNPRKFRFHTRTEILIVCVALCFVAVVVSGCVSADDGSLEKRIHRIESEKQIHNLMVQYGQFLDTLDFAGYSELFAKEGEWAGQLTELTSVKGPAAIRATMEEAFAERVYDPEHNTNLHLISNIKIDVDDDRATAYSRWTVLSRNDSGEPYIRLSGRYDDQFILEEGRWKFLSRVARREIP